MFFSCDYIFTYFKYPEELILPKNIFLVYNFKWKSVSLQFDIKLYATQDLNSEPCDCKVKFLPLAPRASQLIMNNKKMR